MSNNLTDEYFKIEYEKLPESISYPFHIYIYDIQNDSVSRYIDAATPVTKVKKSFIENAQSRKLHLLVQKRQKETFIKFAKYDPEMEVDGVAHPLIKEANDYKQKLDLSKEFIFSREFAKALRTGDYMPLILRVHDELMSIPPTKSQNIVNAKKLASIFLTSETIAAKITSLCYLFAKHCKMNSIEGLADLVIASFVFHLGISQINASTHKKNVKQLEQHEYKDYIKHPRHALHLIKKIGFEISQRTELIILEHHERFSGKGYPDSKNGTQIEPMALILGLFSHLFEYSAGIHGGEKQTIESTFKLIRAKSIQAGLERDFGDTIESGLKSINLDYDTNEENYYKVA